MTDKEGNGQGGEQEGDSKELQHQPDGSNETVSKKTGLRNSGSGEEKDGKLLGNGEADLKGSQKDGPGVEKQAKTSWFQKLKQKRAPTEDTGEKAEEEEKIPPVSLLALFRYASTKDKLLMLIGTITALAFGTAMPLMAVVLGELIQPFVLVIGVFELKAAGEPVSEEALDAANKQLQDEVIPQIVNFLVIGVVVFVVAFLAQSLWMFTGESQARRLRKEFLKAVLRQDMAFFDENKPGEITTRLLADTSLIQDGISEKFSVVLQTLSTFVAGFVVAFVYGWRLTLILLTAVPVMMILGGIISVSAAKFQKQSQDGYAKAGGVAQEALVNVRTVFAFSGQSREVRRYATQLDAAEKADVKMAVSSGVGFGLFFFVMYAVYALGFWYGALMINQGLMTPSQVLQAFFAVVIGASTLGFIAPNFSAIATARGAAAKVYNVIERKPSIDASLDSGTKLDNLQGGIEFKNVTFSYPSRKETPVFTDFSLKIPAGKTVAVVGESGSGKSTLVQLLERYYDVSGGQVLIDGTNIKDLNLRWFRQQVGLVSQEPLLFDGTIRENIALGAEREDAVTEADLDRVCKAANAHLFITDMPRKYDTRVGEKGAKMSGGQKQRIVIARSMMRDPKILLLDEATSALDTASERLVQEALDSVSRGRTTVVIAHRLSTVKKADRIVVLQKGKIVEEGTHEELVALGGVYTKMVKNQELKMKQAEEKRALRKESRQQLTPDATADDQKKPENGEPSSESERLEDSMPKRAESKRLDAMEIIGETSEPKTKFTLKDLKRVFRYQRRDWPILAVAFVAAIVHGVVTSMFALLFSEFLFVFGATGQELTDRSNFLALMFVVIAIAAMVFGGLQIALISVAGSKLTRVLREKAFKAMLAQELGWFDSDKHGSGQLTSQLADDMTKINGAVGGSLGTQIQTFATVVAGLVIAFVNGWQLTLVILATSPILVASGYLQMKILMQGNDFSRKAYAEAGQTACDAIQNIRTVQALTQEQHFNNEYNRNVASMAGKFARRYALAGLANGFSQSFVFLVYALAFYVGLQFVIIDITDPRRMMIVLFAIVFAFMTAGQVSQFGQSASKGQIAAKAFFALLDRTPEVRDPKPEDQATLVDVGGTVVAKNVTFNYPSRPDTRVLCGLDLKALEGKMVALVGQSGSGKSTVIGLTERFYDVDSGSVDVEDVDVRKWAIDKLRGHLSIVSQEPSLFNMTIKENIKYSDPDASDEQVEAAAKSANIHDFIIGLPKGYDTEISGAQLSGGQKQRVAIARALLRNSRILLLDEATSALDSESEQIVQAALDVAARGRTTIVIAHRLSTIQSADLILVIRHGEVIEQGKHFELIERNGVYAQLVRQQLLGTGEQ